MWKILSLFIYLNILFTSSEAHKEQMDLVKYGTEKIFNNQNNTVPINSLFYCHWQRLIELNKTLTEIYHKADRVKSILINDTDDTSKISKLNEINFKKSFDMFVVELEIIRVTSGNSNKWINITNSESNNTYSIEETDNAVKVAKGMGIGIISTLIEILDRHSNNNRSFLLQTSDTQSYSKDDYDRCCTNLNNCFSQEALHTGNNTKESSCEIAIAYGTNIFGQIYRHCGESICDTLLFKSENQNSLTIYCNKEHKYTYIEASVLAAVVVSYIIAVISIYILVLALKKAIKACNSTKNIPI